MALNAKGWADIFRTVDQRRKLTESQRSREKDLKTLVPQAEVEQHVAMLYDDYVETVLKIAPPDVQTQLLNAVAAKWQRRFSNLERIATTPDGDQIIR